MQYTLTRNGIVVAFFLSERDACARMATLLRNETEFAYFVVIDSVGNTIAHATFRKGNDHA